MTKQPLQRSKTINDETELMTPKSQNDVAITCHTSTNTSEVPLHLSAFDENKKQEPTSSTETILEKPSYYNYYAQKVSRDYLEDGPPVVNEVNLLLSGNSTANAVYFQFPKNEKTGNQSLLITSCYELTPEKGPLKELYKEVGNQVRIEKQQRLVEAWSYTPEKESLKTESRLVFNQYNAMPGPSPHQPFASLSHSYCCGPSTNEITYPLLVSILVLIFTLTIPPLNIIFVLIKNTIKKSISKLSNT